MGWSLAALGIFPRKTPMRREEIPLRPQVVALWRGQNVGPRIAINPFLECPLLAQSGHSPRYDPAQRAQIFAPYL